MSPDHPNFLAKAGLGGGTFPTSRPLFPGPFFHYLMKDRIRSLGSDCGGGVTLGQYRPPRRLDYAAAWATHTSAAFARR